MLKGLLTNTNPLTGKTTYYKTVFYAIMTASLVCLFVTLWATEGKSANYFLFISDFERNDDTFMDFFNSIVNTYNDPYDAKVIYPAICSIIFRLLLKLIMPSAFNDVINDPDNCSQPKELKLYQSFMLVYIISFVIVMLMFVFALCAILKNRANNEKAFICFLTLLSSPFLFLIERGNILFLSLAFAMLFFAYYDHKNKFVREFALVCLAFSICIKIYPVVFAIVLLNEKRYKELVRAAVYTAVIFFLPFAFFGGIDGILKFIRNLTSTSSNSSSGVTRQLSFQKFPIYLGVITGTSGAVWNVLSNVMLVICSALGAIGIFLSKERWKTAAICTCLIIGVPGMSSRYSLTFFIIPILLMIYDENENRKLSYFCMSVMSLILAVKPFRLMYGVNDYFGYKIDSFLYLILFFVLCISSIHSFIKQRKEKTNAIF